MQLASQIDQTRFVDSFNCFVCLFVFSGGRGCIKKVPSAHRLQGVCASVVQWQKSGFRLLGMLQNEGFCDSSSECCFAQSALYQNKYTYKHPHLAT